MKNEFSPEEKAELRKLCANRPVGHFRTQCPACSKTRRNKTAQCLSVDIFADRYVFSCHHCECSGAIRAVEEPSFKPPVYEKPKHRALKNLAKEATSQVVEYFAGRGISEKTLQIFGVVEARAFFPDLGREETAAAFPYIVAGHNVGHKVRALNEKSFICDAPLSSLFGLQNVDLSECGILTLCEGECDPMALYEASVLNAVSVPNGASSFRSTNEDGDLKTQLGFLWDARNEIEKAERIFIAVDADEKGQKLAEELARRIGKHRCWIVKFPNDCKDANDVLMKHGADILKQCWENAEPWPISGLYEASHYEEKVMDLFVNGFGERIKTGMAKVDELFSVAPGQLTVVTGVPSNGKTNFVNQLMVNLAKNYGYVSAICSFETPPHIHIGDLAAMLCEKHFHSTNEYGERMTRDELNGVMPFIQRHFKFIHDETGKKSTLPSIIERIKMAVMRYGVRIVVIDPYNYVEKPKTQESETAWIDEMLTEIRLLAQLYDLHIFFVAHTTKLPMNADGTYQPPKGYSISGSNAWFAKPDCGLTVHREPDGDVKILCWKARHSFLFKIGEVTIHYDPARHTYFSDDWMDYQAYAPSKRDYYN